MELRDGRTDGIWVGYSSRRTKSPRVFIGGLQGDPSARRLGYVDISFGGYLVTELSQNNPVRKQMGHPELRLTERKEKKSAIMMSRMNRKDINRPYTSPPCRSSVSERGESIRFGGNFDFPCSAVAAWNSSDAPPSRSLRAIGRRNYVCPLSLSLHFPSLQTSTSFCPLLPFSPGRASSKALF